MDKITLKRATLENAKEIAKIEKSAQSKTYAARIKEQDLIDFINNDSVFLIKNEGVTVGLVSYEVTKKGVSHCNGLVLYPKFRDKGFARKAMKLVLKKMIKYPRAELVVHPHNSPAVSLYLSLGFIIEDWIKNYFGDGEPRLMLVYKKGKI
jgi:ribosomal protein S18 acetylase RimI-like enzyme